LAAAAKTLCCGQRTALLADSKMFGVVQRTGLLPRQQDAVGPKNGPTYEARQPVVVQRTGLLAAARCRLWSRKRPVGQGKMFVASRRTACWLLAARRLLWSKERPVGHGGKTFGCGSENGLSVAVQRTGLLAMAKTPVAVQRTGHSNSKIAWFVVSENGPAGWAARRLFVQRMACWPLQQTLVRL
jgi:hypothetical protein